MKQAVFALAVSLLEACGGGQFAAARGDPPARAGQGAGPAALAPDPTADEGLKHIDAIEAAFRRAIARARPSVVSIFLVEPAGRNEPADVPPDPNKLLGDADSQRFAPVGLGSGIVVDRRGLVLTCYHVVEPVLTAGRTSTVLDRRRVVQRSGDNGHSRPPRYSIIVRSFEGRSFLARVYAADPRSDLAVIKLQATSVDLQPIEIADGSKLFRGQFVLAIGNPFGTAAPDGELSASCGIVSNIRRRSAGLNSPGEEPAIYVRGRTLIQTDARLNMGISGGALINTRGQLVGITMALSAATGFETPGGFALPTDALTRRVIDSLRAGREVEYGFLGVQLDPGLTAGSGSPSETAAEGARIGSLVRLASTERSGLQPGDLVTAINGKRIRNEADLVLEVGSMPVGQRLDLAVRRGQQTLTLELELAKYPVRGLIVVDKDQDRPSWHGIRVDHLSMLALDPAFGYVDPHGVVRGGVVVREVEQGSRANQLGLIAETVITHVNGKRVQTPEEFEREVRRAKPPVRLTIHTSPRLPPSQIEFESTTKSQGSGVSGQGSVR